jgi:hypothetical protein
VAPFVFSARFAAAAASTVFLLSAATADAYVVKKTSSGELVHWESRDVNYSVDPSIEANVLHGGEAARLATTGWSGAVGAPEMHLHDSDASSPTKPGYDGKNGVFFMAGGYAPAGPALAITVLTYDNASGRILDADVIVNGAYTFSVLDTPNQFVASHIAPRSTDAVSHDAQDDAADDQVYDLLHVVAHEFGHSLGMNDELERHGSLMYKYTNADDASLRSPESDDIQGLAELYSTKLEGQGNGCGGATVSPKKPGTGASQAAMAAALGLLVFLVIRARSDRRARIGFVTAAAAAAIALLPASGKDGGVAHASTLSTSAGAARAHVTGTQTSFEDGFVKTTYSLATTTCRTGSCPDTARGVAWGGTVGNIRQDFGGQYAPTTGDDVDVSFRAMEKRALAAIEQPLAGRPAQKIAAEVRVLTLAH